MAEASFSPKGCPAIVAHRGASADEAENTLPAFEAAIVAGAEVVEFDVRTTSDGVVVVMHDPDVSRTTDGGGLIRGLTLAEVKRLRIRTTAGGVTEVPTLAETLEALSGRIGIDIEIKNIPGEPDFDADGERVVDATAAALERAGFSGPVLVSSFNPFSIARAREIVAGVLTGLLTDPTVDARAALSFAREHAHDWVLPFVERVRAAGKGFPAETHAAGLRLGTWIVDDPAAAVALMRTGVDAVATNDPARIASARDEALD